MEKALSSESPFDAEVFLKDAFKRAGGQDIVSFNVERDKIQPISDAAKRLGFDVTPVVVDPITFDTMLGVRDDSVGVRLRFVVRFDPKMYRVRQ